MATFNIEEYLNSLPEDVEAINIEEYLNSLPEDVIAINISNKKITYIPSLERFRKLKELYCGDNELTSLPILPNTLERLYCYHNKLSSLPIINYQVYLIYLIH